jgi:ABC-2 type transport system permease protein
MNAFTRHFSFEFRTGIRNRTLLFLTYLFPLLVYVMLGALMTSVNPFFRDTLIPAMVVFGILSGTLLSLPDQIVTARKAGIYRSYKINGVPAWSILTIPALAVFLHLAVIAAIITFTAPALFVAPLPVSWGGYLLVFLLSASACTGLALLIGVISTSSQMTVLWAQLIFLPSMILGGLMVPTSVLPPAMGRLSLLLPTTYAMDAFRGLAMGLEPSFNPLYEVLILLAGSLLAFGLALSLFTWDTPDAQARKRLPLAALAMLPYLIGMILLPG